MNFLKSNQKILTENFKCKDMAEVLYKTSIRSPNKVFIFDLNFKKKISYKKFNELVNKCCNFFFLKKVKKKDIVTIKLKNSPEFLVIYFASLRYKSIINPIPSSITDFEFEEKIRFLKPKLIFSDNSSKIRKKNLVNLENDFKGSFLNYLDKNFSEKFNSKIVFKSKDTAVLYYSSGTTNNPKIIEYSYYAMIELQKSMVKANFTNERTNHLCVLPFGHTSVLRYSIKQAVFVGSTIFIIDNFWKIKNELFKIIYKYKVNYIQLVPTLVTFILSFKYKIKKKKNLIFGCGSSVLTKDLQIKFEKKFSAKLLNLYGLSEIGASHFENVKKRKLGSIGKPLDIYNFKILSNKKKFCKNYEVGELIVKGKGLFNGYYKNPNLTKKNFYKNFFKTGDLCYIDNKGYYHFVDRKKDLIIKGGINISPNEIDEKIKKIDKNIIESATIGVKDNFYGEIIKSFIVLKNKKKFSLKKFEKKILMKLGNLKCPDIFILKNELPKTVSGKIIKRFINDD